MILIIAPTPKPNTDELKKVQEDNKYYQATSLQGKIIIFGLVFLINKNGSMHC